MRRPRPASRRRRARWRRWTDDLNTPLALSQLHEAGDRLNKASAPAAMARGQGGTASPAARLLGLLQQRPAAWLQGRTADGLDAGRDRGPDRRARWRARKATDFARPTASATSWRPQGIVLEDGPEGHDLAARARIRRPDHRGPSVQVGTAAWPADDKRIYLFDTTLRDGAQTQGVDFGVADKLAIAQALDRLGIDYVEGGWPGANPTDDAFFAEPPALEAREARRLRHDAPARPQRRQRSRPRRACSAPRRRRVCMVGKSWDFHVDVALGIERAENIAMIAESVAHAVAARRARRCSTPSISSTATRPIPPMRCDCAEGGRATPARAGSCSATPMAARCRTRSSASSARSCADDSRQPARHPLPQRHRERGRQQSLAAVRAGARQVQGTLNGLGERCGNANLVSLIPTLMLKTDFKTGIGRDGADAAHPCLAPARRAAQPRAAAQRRLCRRVRLRAQGRPACLGGREGPAHLRAHRAGAGRQPPPHRGLRPVGPRQHPGALPRDRPRRSMPTIRRSRRWSRR